MTQGDFAQVTSITGDIRVRRPPEYNERPVSLYVLRCEKTKLIKIGVSNGVGARMGGVTVIYEREVGGRGQAQTAERAVHRVLSKYQENHPNKRRSGWKEWFRVSRKVAVEMVDAACDGVFDVSDKLGTDAMTLTEFGRALGITRWAIHKAIKSGRIPPDAVGLDRGKQYIKNPALAARWWASSTGVAGRKSRDISIDWLPEDVLAARKLRDMRLAEFAKVKTNELLKNADSIREDVVNVVIASLDSACREALDSWEDRGTKRKLSITLSNLQKKVREELRNES